MKGDTLVITGMGAVTPVGIGVERYWRALLNGVCGIGEVPGEAAGLLSVRRAALAWDFEPRRLLDARLAVDMDRFMQLAFVAAEEALAQSGLDARNRQTGIVMGTALAGIELTGRAYSDFRMESKPIEPRFLTKVMGNMAASRLAIQHGIQGPCLTLSTACSSGGDAIYTAAALLRGGAADAMIVMAGESALSPLLVNSLARAGAPSKSGSSRPFDRARDGFVVGEGGGALVLETLDHALTRGAAPLARLCGCANNTDAYHTVSPQPDGGGAAACMRVALADAGLEPSDIGYVNAHGTATLRGDAAEANALVSVFGEAGVPVSSTKGATGHMMGAGGITETIACVKALETGLMPYTLGLTQPDESCRLNFVIGAPLACRADYAMSNALGFGGQNSSVIVGRCAQ